MLFFPCRSFSALLIPRIAIRCVFIPALFDLHRRYRTRIMQNRNVASKEPCTPARGGRPQPSTPVRASRPLVEPSIFGKNDDSRGRVCSFFNQNVVVDCLGVPSATKCGRPKPPLDLLEEVVARRFPPVQFVVNPSKTNRAHVVSICVVGVLVTQAEGPKMVISPFFYFVESPVEYRCEDKKNSESL